MSIVFEVHNTLTLAKCQDPRQYKLLYDLLSYEVKGAKYIKRQMGVRAKHWNGYKSFYMAKRGGFLTGLLPMVLSELDKLSVEAEVVDRRVKPIIPIGPYTLDGIDLRDYQIEAIEQFLKEGRGIIQLATGAGKSEAAIALTKALGVPTLFLTHRIQLLYQMAQRFAKRMPSMANQIGLIGDSVYEPRRITIATVQTIDSLIKKDKAKIINLLRQYKFLIIDEAHRARSKQFHLPASLCNEAYYRLAMTATPFMRGDPEENLYLTGISGPIIAKVSATDLIERGILAKPFFKFFPINTVKLNKLTSWREIYEQGIIHNDYRNNIIAKQAAKLVASGKKVLVIVVEVEHGKIVEKALLKEGLMARFVTGQNTMAERESALNWFRSNNGQVIVATNIFDEGIDVHEINAVILAAGTKSAPALFQRTGRALRNKGDEANFAIVIDFIDYQHGKLLEHSLARYRLIQSEPGFAILG